MSALSNYAENALLDHLLGTSPLTSPTVHLALYTSDPTDADTGSEVSGGGYARTTVSFDASSGGSASNSSEISFTASGGNYGTVTHIGLRDAASGGNLLAHGALGTSRTVNDGETLTFAAGAITVTME